MTKLCERQVPDVGIYMKPTKRPPTTKSQKYLDINTIVELYIYKVESSR